MGEYKTSEFFHLLRPKIIILVVLIVVVGGILLLEMMNIKASQTVRQEYIIIASGLKKQAEEALRERAYVRARRYLDRALYFAEKGGTIFHKNPLELEIKALIAGNEELKKVAKGFAPLGERWVSREEFIELYTKSQQIKKELRANLTRAAIAFAGEDYDEAIKYYEQVLTELNQASIQGFSELDREKIEKSYKKALLLRSSKRADNFYRNGEYELAVVEYEKVLNIIESMNDKDSIFAQKVQKTVVEALLLSAEKWLKNDNFNPVNAREFIEKARTMLYSHPFLSTEAVSSLEDRIKMTTKKMEILRARKIHELAQDLVKAKEARFMDHINNEMARLLHGSNNKPEKDTEKTDLTVNEKNMPPDYQADANVIMYERARSILKDSVAMLQKSGFGNDTDVRAVVMELQKDIDNLRKIEEAQKFEKAQLWEHLTAAMRLAKAKEESEKYDEAIDTYREVQNTINKSKFRSEAAFASMLDEINENLKRLSAKKRSAGLRQIVASAEEKIASGKLDEVILLAQGVDFRSDDPAIKNDQKIETLARRLSWLGTLAKEMRQNFALAVEQEALIFFQQHGIKNVSVRKDETTIEYCSLMDNNSRGRCLTFNLKGRTIVYTEAQQRYASYPVICDVRLRFCEDSVVYQHRELKCREAKIKSSLGPEPLSFGQLR